MATAGHAAPRIDSCPDAGPTQVPQLRARFPPQLLARRRSAPAFLHSTGGTIKDTHFLGGKRLGNGWGHPLSSGLRFAQEGRTMYFQFKRSTEAQGYGRKGKQAADLWVRKALADLQSPGANAKVVFAVPSGVRIPLRIEKLDKPPPTQTPRSTPPCPRPRSAPPPHAVPRSF